MRDWRAEWDIPDFRVEVNPGGRGGRGNGHREGKEGESGTRREECGRVRARR